MKIPFLTLIAVAFLLVGCSDDPVSESIIGTWNLDTIEFSGCNDPEDNLASTSVDDDNCITIQGDKVCNVFITFSENSTAIHTATVDGDLDTENFTYTTNDDNDTVMLCETDNDCETIQVDGDKITRTITDDGCTIVIEYKKA